MMYEVVSCRFRICSVGEHSLYEPDDELLLCQPIFAQMLLDPHEEFLRYLQRQCPCSVCHSFASLKMFSDDLLNILAQCQRQLLLLLAHLDVQRLRDHGAEVFLLFVHELYSFLLSQAKYTRSSGTKLFIRSNEDHRQNEADATS